MNGKAFTSIPIAHSYGVAVGDYPQVSNHITVQPQAERHWPVLVGLPPQPLARVIERPGLAEWTASPQGNEWGQRLVLIGDRGVGKTELAAAQFRKSVDSGADVGLWVTASSRKAVLKCILADGA